jgi:MFS family permease
MLAEHPPTGHRALLYGLLWLAVAALAAGGAVLITIHLTSSTPLRIVIDLALLATGTVALMLFSDSFERRLSGGFGVLEGPLQWVATVIAALAVAVVLGAAVPSLAPRPAGGWSVVVDFAAGAGALAGLLAVLWILIAGAVFGEAICRALARLSGDERSRRWRRPTDEEKRRGFQLLRGAALGTAGLLLSALVGWAVNGYGGGGGTAPGAHPSALPTVIVPVLAWFAGAGVAWWLVSAIGGDRQRPHPRLRHGTHASALSVGLSVFVTAIAAASINSHARGELWAHPRPPAPTIPVTAAQWSGDSPYLARRFEPRLWLTGDEQWFPTSVHWYMRSNAQANHDPPLCDKHDGCREISKSCDGPDPGSCAPSGAGDPALYYWYIDAHDDRGDPPNAWPHGDWRVIQYWVFYNYDSLRTWAVTQWHQSDWEQVSVLVRRQGQTAQPVEVAFSEHCYGAVLPATLVWWSGTHPTSFVGRGSHANYPRPVDLPVRQLRCSLGVQPRYLGVAGLFYSPAVDGTSLEVPLAYVIGLHDTTARKVPVRTPRLLPFDRTPAIQSFDGAWGLDNNLTLTPLRLGRLRSSAGPPAPQYQGPSTSPLGSMFCKASWLHPPGNYDSWACPLGRR